MENIKKKVKIDLSLSDLEKSIRELNTNFK